MTGYSDWIFIFDNIYDDGRREIETSDNWKPPYKPRYYRNPFIKEAPVDGLDCPVCRRTSEWLSTTNQWQYYCPRCKHRFNEKGEIYAEDSQRGGDDQVSRQQ